MKRLPLSFVTRFFVLWVAFVFGSPPPMHGASFVKGALIYDPPRFLYAARLGNDPGDNPFSGDGPGVQFISMTDGHTNFGGAVFRFGLVGFTFEEGKRITYTQVTTNELERLFADEWQ